MPTRDQIERLKTRKRKVYVDFKEEAEKEGLKIIRDIPDRKKSPLFKRNACKGTKRSTKDSRNKFRKFTPVI